jgi:hypothetical protein
MAHAQDVINALTQQRDSMLNANVMAVAEKVGLQRRVDELEALLAQKDARIADLEGGQA